ncbi:hypothetical protein NEOLEDRAFT_1178143 [Neolentinus lepideus HHB14362 ss-1]|uniref:Uncharacterized protein n=1 Tax=Neolentinus lepideus HHB14362 ss-1 TaxID=1314782 RepID=A0A165SU00_9AGAM|nr:hypothetical protein NEOLEDRAFT_1178143 [Neolentinus lepideus HHB14362 ss-1]
MTSHNDTRASGQVRKLRPTKERAARTPLPPKSFKVPKNPEPVKSSEVAQPVAQEAPATFSGQRRPKHEKASVRTRNSASQGKGVRRSTRVQKALLPTPSATGPSRSTSSEPQMLESEFSEPEQGSDHASTSSAVPLAGADPRDLPHRLGQHTPETDRNVEHCRRSFTLSSGRASLGSPLRTPSTPALSARNSGSSPSPNHDQTQEPGRDSDESSDSSLVTDYSRSLPSTDAVFASPPPRDGRPSDSPEPQREPTPYFDVRPHLCYPPPPLYASRGTKWLKAMIEDVQSEQAEILRESEKVYNQVHELLGEMFVAEDDMKEEEEEWERFMTKIRWVCGDDVMLGIIDTMAKEMDNISNSGNEVRETAAAATKVELDKEKGKARADMVDDSEDTSADEPTPASESVQAPRVDKGKRRAIESDYRPYGLVEDPSARNDRQSSFLADMPLEDDARRGMSSRATKKPLRVPDSLEWGSQSEEVSEYDLFGGPIWQFSDWQDRIGAKHFEQDAAAEHVPRAMKRSREEDEPNDVVNSKRARREEEPRKVASHRSLRSSRKAVRSC